MDLTGKVIVVTGPARGIGRGIAGDSPRTVQRPSSWWTSTVMARGRWPRKSVRPRSNATSRAKLTSCDWSNRWTRRTVGIDIFCSNAGIAVGGGPEAENDDWQRIWEVNVMAHVYVARHVLPSMLARKEGYLVGTVSAAGTAETICSQHLTE